MHYRPPAFLKLDERPVLVPDHKEFETIAPGNIRVTGTWMMHPTKAISQPCLVLTDARKPFVPGRVVPVIIPLKEAYRWMREFHDPGELDDCFDRINGWLTLGFLPGAPGNAHDVHAVFDAIQCRLRDLVFMRPMPEAPAIKYGVHTPETIGELTVTDASTGDVVQEIEVTANVRH